MKSILLSTALVAVGGMAAADISFSGSASLGYNDDAIGDNDGFYSDADLAVSLSQELDNGLTAAASFGIDVEDIGTGHSVPLNGTDFVLSLTNDSYGLYFGDTAHAAETHWSEVGDMVADSFRTQDGENVLRGDMTFGAVSVSISQGMDSSDDDALSLGASGDMGSVSFAFAYQAANTLVIDSLLPAADANFGDDNGATTADEIFGIRVGTSLGGADVALGYASDSTINNDSLGLSVSYPVGPVTLAASYVENSGGAATWDVSAAYASGPTAVTVSTDEASSWALEGSYDVGNGLVVYAGLADAGDDMYVAGAYDLGGGASLLVSYADDQDGGAGDEIGANDYQQGTTIEMSFAF